MRSFAPKTEQIMKEENKGLAIIVVIVVMEEKEEKEKEEKEERYEGESVTQ